MNWSPVNWELPTAVKVPLVALIVCAFLALGGGAIVLSVMWIAATFGEDAAAFSVLGVIGFAIVCLFTWIALEA